MSFSLEWRSMQVLLRRNNGRKNGAVVKLWTAELSCVPFWDKTVPRLFGGLNKKQYQRNEALLCIGLAPRGLKRVNNRVSKKHRWGCPQQCVQFAFPKMHCLNLNFMLTQSQINLHQDPQGPQNNFDLVKTTCQYGVNQYWVSVNYIVHIMT